MTNFQKLACATMFVAFAATLSACAPGGAIHKVGPNTYQITHNMGKFSPVKGVRKGVIDRATEKCANEGRKYTKVREEMTPARTLGYTLTFKCK